MPPTPGSPSRGLTWRTNRNAYHLAERSALDKVFATGEAVAEAKLALTRAREAVAVAEEAVIRAVIRHNAERVADPVVLSSRCRS
ncbi:hypothetical protein A1O3_05404 [Capronia epimyces CBS 606.96]|uniref:Uncharacterized protein n=1 Tax=Capronia epimyces CBS 606.96 TaxID=1182542 RepID=W9XWW4_9EURO|nr:uncharacterized protein A1O3_05404 [Capronia epimyces CBS 606.96]EXJ84733.1 hypothetical protein A1O3_05404 [Capronia epimyces CBS 606.96]